VVGEARVGEPVPEREERLDSELVVAAVADAEALAEAGDFLCPGVLRRLRDRGIALTARESDRQLARWSHIAKEDVSHGVAYLLAAIPALEYRRNLIEPGHQDRAPTGDDDDSTRIGGDNRLYKQILLVGEREECP